MPTKLIAEIGTNWHPGKKYSLKAAVAKALECGADLVKLQVFKADLLAKRRGCAVSDLKPWAIPINWLDEILSDFVGDNGRSLVGISVFDAMHLMVMSSVWNVLPAFIKSATQEYQYAALADTMSDASDRLDIPLIVSMPPDAPLVVGNYSSPLKITWMLCIPRYPAPRSAYDLKRLIRMKNELPGCCVGVSDHTAYHPDFIPLAESWLSVHKEPAISCWEKHFCYDEDLRANTPDSGSWALGVESFKRLAEIVHA